MFGLGVNRLGRLNSSTQAFTPASLFNNGEAGVWYDPSAASGSLDWRKNLLEYTESFDNSYWNRATSDSTAVPVVTANQAMAPDGTQTADLINLTAPADNQWALVRRFSLVTVNRAPEIQQSVWLKAYDSAQVGKKLNAYIYDQTNSGLKTVGVITLTSEWQRFIVSHVFPSGAQNIEVSFGKARNTYGGITQAETATQFYIWGAQVEEASTASSYQPILSTFENAFKTAFPSHTLYQDSQGVTPVTAVGEPVGLMLDKSEGLAQGPELVTNGDFATDSDWTKSANWSIANGVAASDNSVLSGVVYQPTGTTSGSYYRVTFDITAYTSGGVIGRVGNVRSTELKNTIGTHTVLLKSDGQPFIGLEAENYFTGSIDNVSVTEIQGSHATQPTSTKRPIYARHPEGGIRNLLNYTEQFDNGYWTKVGATITANATTAPDGINTADTLTENTSSGQHRLSLTVGVTNNTAYTVSVFAKAGSRSWLRIRLENGVVGSGQGNVWFN
jgi:hypothetical protein